MRFVSVLVFTVGGWLLSCASDEETGEAEEALEGGTGAAGGMGATSGTGAVPTGGMGAAAGVGPAPVGGKGSDTGGLSPMDGSVGPSSGAGGAPDASVYGDAAGACDVLGALGGQNACNGALIDHNCDVVGTSCADKEEIDVTPGVPCTQCVPEGAATTAGNMEAFLTALIADSCQNRCADASDCRAFRIGSTCGVCDVVLYGGTDEEVLGAALAFDEDHCEGNGNYWPLQEAVACVDGVCVLAAR